MVVRFSLLRSPDDQGGEQEGEQRLAEFDRAAETGEFRKRGLLDQEVQRDQKQVVRDPDGVYPASPVAREHEYDRAEIAQPGEQKGDTDHRGDLAEGDREVRDPEQYCQGDSGPVERSH